MLFDSLLYRLFVLLWVFLDDSLLDDDLVLFYLLVFDEFLLVNDLLFGFLWFGFLFWSLQLLTHPRKLRSRSKEDPIEEDLKILIKEIPDKDIWYSSGRT